MARLRKKEAEGLGILVVLVLVIGAIIGLAETLFAATGFTLPIVAVSLCLIGYVAVKNQRKKKRQSMLLMKYGDQELVARLMDGLVWQEQSAEQLRDALGDPLDVEQKVLKTKKKEVWKYQHEGGNKYRLRITLENGLVVGWDKR